VSTDVDGTNSWKLCFKVDGVHLPTGYYFGASAATGDLSGKSVAQTSEKKSLTKVLLKLGKT